MALHRSRKVFLGMVLTLSLLQVSSAPGPDPAVRDWEIDYRAIIHGIPAGARSLRVWVPLPRNGDGQSISNLRVTAPIPHHRVIDREYGNMALLFESDEDLADSIPLEFSFQAHRTQLGRLGPIDTGAAFARMRSRFLSPDSLVPIDGEIRELASGVAKGATTDRAKARAIYEFILGTMRYDKSGTGWGQGDAVFACNSRRGNCTDIHSLFIGMARASGIPARFVMGIQFPPGENEGFVAGYHCWADIYLEGLGWVPIDASEAIKHRELADYYFGTLDPDRVAFSIGRDIRLGDDSSAPRVNYFIYPVVQIDGQAHSGVTRQITFRTL